MEENNFQIIDKTKRGSMHNIFISKNFANYTFKGQVTWVGKHNNCFFFGKHNYIDFNDLIIIQQQFAVNGKMKIFKKWFVEGFQNIVLMHKSNSFIIATDFKILIKTIDCFYNLNIAQVIFTYKGELEHKSLIIPFSQVVLSEDENLIIASMGRMTYFLIKEENGKWKLQQKENISLDENYFIQGYQLNNEGNILIVSLTKFGSYAVVVVGLNVFLRVDGLWKMIKELNIQLSYQQYCFLDNHKFIVISKENDQPKLSIFEIFLETFEVKLMKTQDIKISENVNKLKFLKQRGLLIARSTNGSKPFIYIIQEVNNEFKISSQISISEELYLRAMINEELLVFGGSIQRKYKLWVLKLYGK